MDKKLSRREFLVAAAASAAVAALGACQPEEKIVEKEVTRIVEGTVVVEKVVETKVVEKVVTATPVPEPVTLNMNMPLNRGDPATQVDPGCSAMYQSYFMNYLMWSSLVALNEDLEPIPDVAESWQVSDDALTYTFNLRKDVYWSDGSQVTAHDFEWSVKRNLQPNLYCGGQYWQLVDVKNSRPYYTGEVEDPDTVGLKALDDFTLQVELENPAAYFINVVTLPSFSALPRGPIEEHGETWWTKPEYTLTNGPFDLEEYIPDLRYTFKANEDYHMGRVGVDKLVVNMITQPQTALAAYEAGDELMVCMVEATELPRVQADPDLNAELVSVNELAVYHLIISRARPPLDDVRVCNAIAMAIDKQTLCDKIIPGIGSPAYQFLAPGLLGYDPEIGRELEFNPEKARALLAEAGFPDGKDWPYMYWSYRAQPMEQAIYEALQAMIQENLGVYIELAPANAAASGIDLGAERYPNLARQYWGADYPDPHNFMAILYTSPPPQSSAWDSPDVWSDPEFDDLVWAAAAETDVGKRKDLYAQCEQRLCVTNPKVIPLYYPARHRLVKPYVKDLIINGQGAPILRKVRIEGKV